MRKPPRRSYHHYPVTAGAAARDRRAALDLAFAQLLTESPSSLVAYAARLCAHAAERTERGDLARQALELNEIARDLQGQPATCNLQPATASPSASPDHSRVGHGPSPCPAPVNANA